MKNHFLLRWFWTLIEYLMIFPIILIISGLLLPADYSLIFIFTLPLHTLVAIIITVVLKKFRNILIYGIGAIYIFLISWVWFLASAFSSKYMLVLIIGSTLFFIRGIKKATGGGPIIFFYMGGLVIHGISLFLLSRVKAINPYFDIAMIASVIYVAIALPLANRHFLIIESQQKNSLSIMPSSVIKGNRMIVIFILVAIGLLSIGKYLVAALNYLVKVIVGAVDGLMKLLSSSGELSQQPVENNNSPPIEMPQAEANPLVEIISEILSILFVLVILYFLTKYLIKNHKRIIKNIFDFFSRLLSRFRRWSSTEQSYTDKQELLIKTDELKKASFLRRLFKKEKRWRDMKDNSSRIRFIYTKFVLDSVKKGFRFRLSDTPSETVERINGEIKGGQENHQLINESYNQAYYGNKETSDETVRILRDRYL